MPFSQNISGDTIQFAFDARTSGRDEWNMCVCNWSKYVQTNINCPWSDEDWSSVMVALLGAGSQFLKWVDQWKSSPNLHLVQFIFAAAKPWGLRIGAFVSQNSSSSYYRVLDLTADPPVVGLDDNGNLTTLVIGKASPDPAAAANPQPQTVTVTAPNFQPQAAILTQVTPQQIAVMVADANSRLRAAGGNVAAALDRLKQAAVKAALQAGVDRTRAALDQLVTIAGSAGRS
jgi:hypothetical protein